MNTVVGTVEKVVRKKAKRGERTAVLIEDRWYSTFDPIDVEEGQDVVLQYEERNGFCNIVSVKPKTNGNGSPASPKQQREQEREGHILRSVALKAAVELVKAFPEERRTPEECVAVAAYFEEYLTESADTDTDEAS